MRGLRVPLALAALVLLPVNQYVLEPAARGAWEASYGQSGFYLWCLFLLAPLGYFLFGLGLAFLAELRTAWAPLPTAALGAVAPFVYVIAAAGCFLGAPEAWQQFFNDYMLGRSGVWLLVSGLLLACAWQTQAAAPLRVYRRYRAGRDYF